jgi:hypothetical protein
MTKIHLKDLLIGILASVIATFVTTIIFTDDKKIKVLSLYVIFTFCSFLVIYFLIKPTINLIRNYKFIKGLNFYLWDLNRDNPNNDFIKFSNLVGPIVENAKERIIVKLNSGEVSFELFSSRLKANQNIKHLEKFDVIFSNPKISNFDSGFIDGKIKKTIAQIKEDGLLISKGRKINFKLIKEEQSFYNFVIIDNFCIFSIGGVMYASMMVYIDLNKCHNQIKNILNRLVEYTNENCTNIP